MAAYAFTSERAKQFIPRLMAKLEESANNNVRGLTRAQLETALSASKSRIVDYVRYLRKERRIYICGYVDLENGGRTPRYAVGNRPDAKPPVAKTDAQLWAETKASADKHEHIKAKWRAYNARKRATAKPHGWAAALGV